MQPIHEAEPCSAAYCKATQTGSFQMVAIHLFLLAEHKWYRTSELEIKKGTVHPRLLEI